MSKIAIRRSSVDLEMTLEHFASNFPPALYNELDCRWRGYSNTEPLRLDSLVGNCAKKLDKVALEVRRAQSRFQRFLIHGENIKARNHRCGVVLIDVTTHGH